MPTEKRAIKSEGWALFDQVVRSAALRDQSPWFPGLDGPTYAPDYATLKMLLRVPYFLGASSTSGLPALALDVWAAYELRRAGFDRDAVWPRDDVPRILPGPIARLLRNMGKADAARLRELLASGKTLGGSVSASARVLGKNYMKQVDVVMSDWDTGPEILISTKRMDDSYTNNAPNRMEESYGDAKNLRSRHPRAALGFVFALRADAFVQAPRAAAWILDLLAKLGREDDAYDSVALIVPRYVPRQDCGVVDYEDETEAERRAIVSSSGTEGRLLGEVPTRVERESDEDLFAKLSDSCPVELMLELVPPELTPDRFFANTVQQVLDNAPITRHEVARRLLEDAIILSTNA